MPPQETYSLLSLDEDLDEDRDGSTLYAPLENMFSAAREIVQRLGSSSSSSSDGEAVRFVSETYAIQGGFSMQLRGGRRSTRDIDLITTRKMRGVWDAITGNERIVIPDSRLVEGVIKVFIKTGQPWDACAEEHRIEVDIKQAGFRGSPRRLEESTEIVGPFHVFGEKLFFRVLDITSMIRIKVECCLTREEPRDFEDVKFMINSYPSRVREALKAGSLHEDDLLEAIQNEMIGGDHDRAKLESFLSSSNLRKSTDSVQETKSYIKN